MNSERQGWREPVNEAGNQLQKLESGSGIWLHGVAVGVCVLCSFAAFWGFHVRDISENQHKFNLLATESLDAMQSRLQQYEGAIAGLAGLFDVVENPTQDDVRTYVNSLDIAHSLPGLNGMGYIEPVAAAQRAEYVARANAAGSDGFNIHPETGRYESFVIRYIEPLADNREALGLDIAFEQGRRNAAESARDTGQVRLTPRILLVQDETRQPGFLLLAPIYNKGSDPQTVSARRAAFKGWVYAPFVGASTLRHLTPTLDNNFDLWVYAGQPDADNLIYATASDAPADHADGYVSQSKVDAFGQSWTVTWVSRPGFAAPRWNSAENIVLALGLLLSGLIALLFQDQRLRERQVRAQVRDRTRELATQIRQNESVINNPLFGIVIADVTGRVLRANAAAQAYLDIAEKFQVNGVVTLPEHLTAMQDSTRTRLEFDRPDGGLVLAIKKNIWMTPEGEHRGTYFIRDITAEEAKAQAMAEAEERLESALSASEIAVFEVNLRTGVSIVSDIWKRIMGVPDAPEGFDAQGYLLSRIDPDDRRLFEANDLACIRGETARSLSEFRVNLDSGTRWMRSVAFVSKRDADGKALRLIGTQVDITELKAMDQVKNEFIATVSHELRTPITSIKDLGAVGVISKPFDPLTLGDQIKATLAGQ